MQYFVPEFESLPHCGGSRRGALIGTAVRLRIHVPDAIDWHVLGRVTSLDAWPLYVCLARCFRRLRSEIHDFL